MDIIAAGIMAMFIAWRISSHWDDIETAPKGKLVIACVLFWGGLTAALIGLINWGMG